MVPLKKHFNTLLQGETRAIHSELAEKGRQLDSMKTVLAAAKSSRLHADRAARTLAEENDTLLAKVAELSASYASLMGRHASNVRKAGLDARQAKLREQKLERALGRAMATSEELAADAASSRSAELEAEELLAEAEKRVQEAEERADEAVADAKAAAAATAVAEAEVTDAAYVEAVLTAKLGRAAQKMQRLQQEWHASSGRRRSVGQRTALSTIGQLSAERARGRRRSASGSISQTSSSRTRGACKTWLRRSTS